MKWVYNWRVVSDTSGKEYVVSIADDGTFGCSCPAWTRRRMECKHIKKIKRYQGKEINMAIERFEIPLVEDVMTRDWVKVEDGGSLLDVDLPECTDKRSIAVKCNAYEDGYCRSESGPCKRIDTKNAKMSRFDEVIDKLKDDPIEAAMRDKLKKDEPAPTLMTLITKNAQWRI